MAQTKREDETMLHIRFVCPGPNLQIPRQLGMTAKELLRAISGDGYRSFMLLQCGEADTQREEDMLLTKIYSTRVDG